MDISSLYKDIIMEYSKKTDRKGFEFDEKAIVSSFHNPSCGDKVEIQIKLDGSKIEHMHYDGHGCTICCASAGIICEDFEGKTVTEALTTIDNFSKMLTSTSYEEKALSLTMQALKGVSQFPARIKCAMLPHQAVKQGLDKYGK
jgi:nitrogen fixation NifU-like protein